MELLAIEEVARLKGTLSIPSAYCSGLSIRIELGAVNSRPPLTGSSLGARLTIGKGDLVETVLQWIRDNPAESVVAALVAGVLLQVPFGVMTNLLTDGVKASWRWSVLSDTRTRIAERRRVLAKLTHFYEDPAALQAELITGGLGMLTALSGGSFWVVLILLMSSGTNPNIGTEDARSTIILLCATAMFCFLFSVVIGLNVIGLYQTIRTFPKHKAKIQSDIAKLESRLPHS